MREVTIDVPASLLAGLSQEALTQVARNIADGARAHWVGMAKEELQTSRRDYIRGIQPTTTGTGTATVALLGVLPNVIENGMPATDLRKTLLGPSVPVAPEGMKGKRETLKGNEFYRAIPFRHQAYGTAGTKAPPMGSAYEKAEEGAGILGKDIYKAAKALAPTVSDPYTGKVDYGERLPAELTGKLKPHHKSDIYAGMIREEKTYERATQSSYMTFRMIATHRTIRVPGKGKRKRRIRVKSTVGWQRRATEGVRFAEKSAEHASSIATGAIKTYLEQVA